MRSKETEKLKIEHEAAVEILDQIATFVTNHENFLVVSHVDPDGDALGSQLAFARYLRDVGKNSTLLRKSQIPEKYLFLPEIESILPIDEFKPRQPFDAAVILECPSVARIGGGGSFISNELDSITIDHHIESVPLGSINWLDTNASSVGEMLYEYFEYVNYIIPEEVATHLYTAILTDTGRFRYSCTSPRTMEIGGKLIAAGADSHSICDAVYYRMPQSSLKLLAQVLGTLEFHQNGKICLLTINKEMLSLAGASPAESDGIVDFVLHTRGAVAGALLNSKAPDLTKVSLRSLDSINVAEIASKQGGGGHKNAAGCTFHKNLAETKRELLEALSKAVDNGS